MLRVFPIFPPCYGERHIVSDLYVAVSGQLFSLCMTPFTPNPIAEYF